MKNLKRILVPTDFSEASIYALGRAVDLARDSNAELLLLYVMREADFPTRQILKSRNLPDLKEEIKQGVEVHLREFQAEHIPADVSSQALLHEGVPSAGIVRVAKKHGVDLIVIATHGHTGFKHFFVGSTTERIVQIAPCSVLVVKDEQAAGDADPTS